LLALAATFFPENGCASYIHQQDAHYRISVFYNSPLSRDDHYPVSSEISDLSEISRQWFDSYFASQSSVASLLTTNIPNII